MTQQTQIQEERQNATTQELGSNLYEKAVKRIATADSVLNESFSYKLKVGDNDSVRLNEAVINGNGKKTSSVLVEVNSNEAKKQLKEVAGIDFDSIQATLNNAENQGASAIAKLSLASTLKRFGKTLVQ